MKLINYGGIVFHDFYDKAFSLKLNGESYSWTIPDSKRPPEKNDSELNRTKKPQNLPGVTEYINAKQIGGTIQYYDSSKKLLWAAKVP